MLNQLIIQLTQFYQNPYKAIRTNFIQNVPKFEIPDNFTCRNKGGLSKLQQKNNMEIQNQTTIFVIQNFDDLSQIVSFQGKLLRQIRNQITQVLCSNKNFMKFKISKFNTEIFSGIFCIFKMQKISSHKQISFVGSINLQQGVQLYMQVQYGSTHFYQKIMQIELYSKYSISLSIHPLLQFNTLFSLLNIIKISYLQKKVRFSVHDGLPNSHHNYKKKNSRYQTFFQLSLQKCVNIFLGKKIQSNLSDLLHFHEQIFFIHHTIYNKNKNKTVNFVPQTLIKFRTLKVQNYQRIFKQKCNEELPKILFGKFQQFITQDLKKLQTLLKNNIISQFSKSVFHSMQYNNVKFKTTVLLWISRNTTAQGPNETQTHTNYFKNQNKPETTSAAHQIYQLAQNRSQKNI
eukprot:TRINITY_DN4977_c0_g2_i3.p1 TRINITY_DN4977_c0_g2~~TRINITY_DN4977_c0_g2_i3.p1  ORF type:complete len:402 (-),score=-12.84 TRINITY_DN4977_c0_g2_i3:125-1330(-)